MSSLSFAGTSGTDPSEPTVRETEHRVLSVPDVLDHLPGRRAVIVATLAVAAVLCVAGAVLLGLLPLPSLSRVLQALAPLFAVVALRAADVTLGVFKTTFTVAGRRSLASLCAAAEAALWVSAAGIVFREPTPGRVIAFAVGVGLGTLIGMEVVRRLRLGPVTVRVFVPGTAGAVAAPGKTVADAIRDRGFGATLFHGEGRSGPVDMILCVTRRREARHLCEYLDAAHPETFVAIDNAPAPGSRVGTEVGARL